MLKKIYFNNFKQSVLIFTTRILKAKLTKDIDLVKWSSKCFKSIITKVLFLKTYQ